MKTSDLKRHALKLLELSIAGFTSGYAAGFAGIANSFSYNQRLQPANISASAPSATVFSIGYDFHITNGDNGKRVPVGQLQRQHTLAGLYL